MATTSSQTNLFAALPSGPRPLVQFKAGKMFKEGTLVKPDKRKGTVTFIQDDSNVLHYQWADRATGAVEDDFMIFRDDAKCIRVDKAKGGRVFLLEWNDKSRQIFLWLQEPNTDKDNEFLTKINEYIANPPQPEQSGPMGMGREQLLALLSGMGMGGAGAGRGRLPPNLAGLAQMAGVGASPSQNQQSQAQSQAQAQAQAQARAQQVQLGDLMNILAGLGGRPPATPQTPASNTAPSAAPNAPAPAQRPQTQQSQPSPVPLPQTPQTPQQQPQPAQSAQPAPTPAQPSSADGAEALMNAVQAQADAKKNNGGGSSSSSSSDQNKEDKMDDS